MAFNRDPALAIWQAMKPLAEVGARTDAPDIAKIVTEAEIIPDIAVWHVEQITPLTV